jgi:putative transposase
MGRNIVFAEGEFYHIYNRGVEKRNIVMDDGDRIRFLKSLTAFNSILPIGSIHELKFKTDNLEVEPPSTKTGEKSDEKLVELIAYCINPNHYHLLVQQIAEDGVSKFMQRLGGGYTMYFNEKHERKGGLFQGKFKATHVATNEYLLHVSAYVNLNPKVHGLGGSTSKSSWGEYVRGERGICEKESVLGQFKNGNEYEDYAQDALPIMLQRKNDEHGDYKSLLIET